MARVRGATSVNLGFLGPSRLAAKIPIHRYWIFLDFLGFSRPNRDLSIGYTDFRGNYFSSRFSPYGRGAGTGADSRGPCGSAGLLMGQV